MSSRYHLNEELARLQAELAKISNDLSLPPHLSALLYDVAVTDIRSLRAHIQDAADAQREGGVR